MTPSNNEGGWDLHLPCKQIQLEKAVLHLTPNTNIVEYDVRANAPLYDLIIGKQSLYDLGAVWISKKNHNHT